MQHRNEEGESFPTMAEIIRNFNNTCNHRYPSMKRPTMDQRIMIFDEVTGGGWSAEFENVSEGEKSRPGEITRNLLNLSSSPKVGAGAEVKIKARVTVLTRDGMITREAIAKEEDRGPDSIRQTGQRAFIRAVMNLAQTDMD